MGRIGIGADRWRRDGALSLCICLKKQLGEENAGDKFTNRRSLSREKYDLLPSMRGRKVNFPIALWDWQRIATRYSRTARNFLSNAFMHREHFLVPQWYPLENAVAPSSPTLLA